MISQRQFTRWALAFASASLLASPGYGAPPTATTITPTSGFGTPTAITTTGNTTFIPASAGVQNGGNLFHSFNQFDVASGDIAEFTGAGKTGAVNNIIARVFGNASQIYGTLEVDPSTLAGANLFLINPAGVIFGAGSSVSVPGNFVVSTSDYITLSNGSGFFYADPSNPNNTTLSNSIMAAPVSSFGFLKGQSLTGAISVANSATLSVGGSLQFVTSNFTAAAGSTLTAQNSTPLGIFAGSQTSGTTDGLVPYLTGTVTNYSTASNITGGSIHLGDSTGGATLSSTGATGSVVIRGGQLVQLGGKTSSITQATKSVSIQADDFQLSGTVQTTGTNGTINIDNNDSTGTVTLTGGAITSAGGSITMGAAALGGLSLDGTSSITDALGSGGTLSLASTGTISNGGTISTVGSTNALKIAAQELDVTGTIVSGTVTPGTGTISSGAGAIGIDTTGLTALTMGGKITSAGGAITMGQTSLLDLTLDAMSSITETAGTGKTLRISATDAVTNGGTISTSGANAIAITAPALTDSGTISTVTGALGIDTTGATTLTGGTITSAGGAITLGQTSLGSLSLDATSSIRQTAGTAPMLTIKSTGTITDAGAISAVGNEPVTINALGLVLNGGTIQANGAITIGNTALTDLSLSSGSAINSTGNSVTITARGNITMTGGLIETTATGATRAGNVVVNDATGNITMSGGAEIASISSSTSTGGSGNVSINPNDEVQNSSTLSITGTGVAAFSNNGVTGQAAFDADIGPGIEAPNTGIYSIDNGTGSAGNVNVVAPGNVVLAQGGQIAALQTNTTGGGTGAVTLNMLPDQFFSTGLSSLTIGGVTVADGSAPVATVPIIFTSSANAASSSGSVTINALSTTVELQPGAVIQTSTQDGQAGNIGVFGGSVTLDPYTDIQSLQGTSDTAVTGRTGSITVEVFNLDLSDFLDPFVGPLNIDAHSFIQTRANLKTSSPNTVGTVQVFAGSLTESGNVITDSDGFNFDYNKTNGEAQILAVNNATLNGANGIDVGSQNKVTVQNLFGFPNSSSAPNASPSAGNGVVLDGTLNNGDTGALLPIPAVPYTSGVGYTYMINVGDGTQVGSNLFLSFYTFNLGFNGTGAVPETALFDAPGVINIVARITNGTKSRIDGLIEETADTNANLFLLNSAGFLFTGNSAINLNGAFTLSTANSITLGNGGTFYTTGTQTQLIADDNLANNISTGSNLGFEGAVSAFTFGPVPAVATTTPVGVLIDGAILSNANSANGQIQIISGDILLEDDALLNATQTFLFATDSNGTLGFKSGNSLTTFPTAPTPLTTASTVLNENFIGALGSISLTGGSVLTVPTPNIASTILIRGQSFNLTDSLIIDQTTAEDGSVAGEVVVDVTGGVTISTTNDPSFISTSALGDEAGGAVFIDASSLTISGSITSTTGILSTAEPTDYFTSDAGYIPFPYPNANVMGSAGSISLNISGAITLSNFGQISTNTNGRGNAGIINITGPAGSRPQISVGSGASISSSANIDPMNLGNFTQAGNAGQVSIIASALTVTGAKSQIVTSAGTAVDLGATGAGGSVRIDVDGATGTGPNSTGDIIVSNDGQISASSFNTSLAGQVFIQQANSTDLADPATNPATIGGLYVNSGGSITTADNGTGALSNSNASLIQLEVQAVTVNGGSITSSTLGKSSAGSITINNSPGGSGNLTDFVLVENGGVISSNTSNPNNLTQGGNGGTITIDAGSLNVTGTGSTISTSSTAGSLGNGGSIALEVKGNALALGSTGDVLVASGGAITSSSETVGQAGNIAITQSGSLDLADPATNPTTIGGVYVNGGTISTAADGTGTTAGSINNPPGTITIGTQALTVNGTTASITSSTSGLSKAGNITIQGVNPAAQFVIVEGGGSIASNTSGTGNGGTISINTGALTVTGMGSEISTNATNNMSSASGGNIMLTVQGSATKIGSTGDVKLTSGGTIAASSAGTGNAGTVTITQKGSIDLSDPATNPAIVGGMDLDDGSITTIASGTGVASASNPTAGDITLNTQALTMTDGSSIISSTRGLSKAGSITINGTDSALNTQWVMVNGGSQIASNTSGAGAGGAISIKAGAFTLDGTGSAITTSAKGASTAATGSGGSIALSVTGNAAIVGATGDVAITNGGTISASSTTMGDAGTVTITQVGSRDILYPLLATTTNGGLLLNDGTITTAAAGAGTANSPDTTAGNITLQTEALTMTGGSVIQSSSAGASKAGDVSVSGPAGANTQFVVLEGGSTIASETSGSGNGGTITMGTGSLLVDASALTTSATAGTGSGGDITVTAVSTSPTVGPFITVQDAGTISSSSQGEGSAGIITLSAGRVTVTGLGSAISTDAGANGNAAFTHGKIGEIFIAGQDLFIDQSGLVSATTGGLTGGGSITVRESNEVDLTNDARMDASSTAAAGGGNGGSILIGSDPNGPLFDVGGNSPFTVNLANNSVISCDSSNTNGGNIGIQTASLTMDHSLISTSEPNGPTDTVGGNITINALYTFYLNNFSFINSNAGQGTGGNITIDPEFTVLNHSGINAIGGSANGNVFIESDFVLSGTSTILATGVVDISSLPLDLTGSLLPLPANLTDEQKRLREKCARAVNHEFSSFIVVGRGGTESAPEEFQPDFGLDSLPSESSAHVVQ